MDRDWIYSSFLWIQIFCAVMGIISLSRFLLPLKIGLENKDQKLISKGIAYLVVGIMCYTLFFILIIMKLI